MVIDSIPIVLVMAEIKSVDHIRTTHAMGSKTTSFGYTFSLSFRMNWKSCVCTVIYLYIKTRNPDFLGLIARRCNKQCVVSLELKVDHI